MKSPIPLKWFLFRQFAIAALCPVVVMVCLAFMFSMSYTVIMCLLFSGIVAALCPALALSLYQTGKLSLLFHIYAKNTQSIAEGHDEIKWPPAITAEFLEFGQSLQVMGEQVRKREQHMGESEKRIKHLMDNIPGMVFQFRSTKDHKYTNEFISSRTTEIFGLDLNSETILDEFFAHIPDEEKHAYTTSMRQAIDAVSPWTYEGRFIKPNGDTIWFSGHAIPSDEGETIVYSGILLDITRRKEAESSLRLSQFIFDTAAIGIYQTGMDGRFINVNPYAARMLGYTREELLCLTVFDIGPGYTSDMWESDKEKVKCEGGVTVEAFHKHKNGNVLPVQLIAKKSTYMNQDLHVVFVQDITDRKQMEQALKDSEKRLELALDGANEGIWDWEIQENVLYFDDRYYTMAGYRPHEFPNTFDEVKKRIHPDDVERALSVNDRYLAGKLETFDVEFRFLCKDGSYMWIQARGKIVSRDDNGKPLRFIGTHTDINERKRMEEMMIQNEKMLTVGGLAAGMAHEINNPLAGMMQTAGVMANRLGADLDIPANRKAAEKAGTTIHAVYRYMEARSIHRMLETIIESGKRVAEIVDNMLSFARKSESTVSTQDLGKLLDKTLELAVTDYDLRKTYDFKRIAIEKDYAAPPVLAPCEDTKIQQVLLNVLRNGAQAMEEVDSPRFIFRTRPDGDMAVIEIEDNGKGMDEATRKKVFEPFFTTKPVGVGTGLGLSVSYFIITENHGGEMRVESSPGEGAKFTISLPLSGSHSE